MRSNFWQITIGLPFLVAYLVLSRLVVFPWQIVGLLRCCEKHYVRHGQTLTIRAIQGLVVVIMINAVGVIDSMQWYLSRQKQALEKASISNKKNYSLGSPCKIILRLFI